MNEFDEYGPRKKRTVARVLYHIATVATMGTLVLIAALGHNIRIARDGKKKEDSR